MYIYILCPRLGLTNKMKRPAMRKRALLKTEDGAQLNPIQLDHSILEIFIEGQKTSMYVHSDSIE